MARSNIFIASLPKKRRKNAASCCQVQDQSTLWRPNGPQRQDGPSGLAPYMLTNRKMAAYSSALSAICQRSLIRWMLPRSLPGNISIPRNSNPCSSPPMDGVAPKLSFVSVVPHHRYNVQPSAIKEGGCDSPIACISSGGRARSETCNDRLSNVDRLEVSKDFLLHPLPPSRRDAIAGVA